jgi:oxygen-independent coproporphyrinogen-3 oxidase
MEKKLPLPDEDAAERMYFEGIDLLAGYGLQQYEISNFAKAGYESHHNLKYWNCDEYLGLGVAAHSDFCGERFGNSRDLDGFLRGEDIIEFTEVLTDADREAEYIMLALRLYDGIDESDFRARFGHDFRHRYGDICISYVERGLMEWEHGRVRLTEAGFSVSNAILTELLADLL